MKRRGFIKMLGVTPAIGLLPKIKSKKKEVYFSDQGNDTMGDGSFGKPYKTITRACRDRPEIAWYILSAGEFQHTISIPSEWNTRVK